MLITKHIHKNNAIITYDKVTCKICIPVKHSNFLKISCFNFPSSASLQAENFINNSKIGINKNVTIMWHEYIRSGIGQVNGNLRYLKQ